MTAKRNVLGLLSMILFALCLSSCATAQNSEPLKKDAPPEIVRTGIYQGFVSVDGNSVIIITNYKSRSRVDYQVTGNLKARIAALDGQLVTVVGTARRQGWSGTIEVVKILKPKKIPPLSPPSRK